MNSSFFTPFSSEAIKAFQHAYLVVYGKDLSVLETQVKAEQLREHSVRKRLALRDLHDDQQLHDNIFKTFLKGEPISTAQIQRRMHVPYRCADEILDWLVVERFATPRVGSFPCTVV